MSAPRSIHWEVALRIIRYLKVHPERGLPYRAKGHLQVKVFTDANRAGSPSDKRFTTEYCTFLSGNVVSWKSKKRTVVIEVLISHSLFSPSITILGFYYLIGFMFGCLGLEIVDCPCISEP